MIEQLFIDGREVDMGSGGDITLIIRSNIFSDISKITGNSTTTIKIPLTANNRAIIECCFTAGTQSSFPYAEHSASVIRDGVVVVREASAVLMKTTTTEAEIALTWGVPNTLTKFVSKAATIDQLSEVADIIWQRGSSQRQPEAQYGFKADEQNATYHPVLSFTEILSKIQADNHISFAFEKRPWEDADLVIPVIKRNSTTNTARFSTTTGIRSRGIASSGLLNYATEYVTKAYLTAVEWNGLSGLLDDIELWDRTNKVVFTNIVPNVKIKLTGQFIIALNDAAMANEIGLNDARTYNGGLYAFKNYKDIYNGEFLTSKRPDAIYTRNVDGQSITYLEFNYNEEEVHLDDTRMMMFCLDQHHFSAGGAQFGPIPAYTHTYECNDMRADTTRDRLQVMQSYPLTSNLPKIKQIDFIKAVMQMYGMFAFLDENGVINFSSLSTLIGNKSNAQDWSEYLVANAEGIPNATEFKVGEEAKSNRMRYKDADAFPEWNSRYTINNSSLPDERDAVTLPFKPYLNRSTAILPVYSYDDEGVLQYNGDDTAYVCRREEDEDGNYTLTNFGCRWPELMANYANYTAVLNGAKVVTENFVLSPFQLRNVDLRRPVYLRQYGQHYAIIEIKTKARNLAEVKLIKL